MHSYLFNPQQLYTVGTIIICILQIKKKKTKCLLRITQLLGSEAGNQTSAGWHLVPALN